MAEQAYTDCGLADALCRTGYDIDAAAKRTGHDIKDVRADPLVDAQEAGAVRRTSTPQTAKR